MGRGDTQAGEASGSRRQLATAVPGNPSPLHRLPLLPRSPQPRSLPGFLSCLPTRPPSLPLSVAPCLFTLEKTISNSSIFAVPQSLPCLILSSVPCRLPFILPIPGLLRPSSPLSFRGLHFPSCLDLSFLLLPGSCDPGTLSVSLPDLPLMLSILQLSIFCGRPPPQSILSGTSPPHRLPLHLSPPFSRLTSLPSLSPSLLTALSTAHFPSPFPRLSHLTPCYSLRALHVQIWTQKPEDTECHILIHWGACCLPLGLPPSTLRTCPPLSEPSIPMILPDSLPRRATFEGPASPQLHFFSEGTYAFG